MHHELRVQLLLSAELLCARFDEADRLVEFALLIELF